jgi:hypothetical protein
LAAFLFFSPGQCASHKKDDKTAAPGDQQASLNTGSGWIFLFWHKGTTANIKKDKGAAMRKKEERKKHDKLAIATRRAAQLSFIP